MELSILGGIFTACLLISNHLGAYPTPTDFDGKPKRWSASLADPTVTVYVESLVGNEQAMGLLTQAAMGMWNNVEQSYLMLTESDDPDNTDITITFKESIVGSDFSSGFSSYDQYDDNGPVHCQIEILISQVMTIRGLGRTILHELGHCLGLGHSLVPQAVMSYDLDKNNFALDIDDEAAVSRLYPADGSDPQFPVGCAVTNVGTYHLSLTAYFWLLLPLSLLSIGIFPTKYGKDP